MSKTKSPLEWILALSVDVYVHAMRVLHVFGGICQPCESTELSIDIVYVGCV